MTPSTHNTLMLSDQITPVHKLPPELLSAIFVLLVNAVDAQPNRGTTNDFIDYSTIIASVCVCWRHVAINIPYLWSDIRLLRVKDTARVLESIQLWHERSRDLPLRVLIRKPMVSSQDHHWIDLRRSAEDQVMSILRTCAPRLGSLTLKCSWPGFCERSLSALSSEKANVCLRELSLGGTYSSKVYLIPLLSLGNISQLLAPLHVLHLECVKVNLDEIPCRNLTELRIINLVNELSEVQLVRLWTSNLGLQSIESQGLTIIAPFHTGPIELPALRVLKLSMSSDYIDWILGALVPPPHEINLYLYIQNERGSLGRRFESPLAEFFKRARVKLLFIKSRWQPKPLFWKSISQLQHLRLNLHDLLLGTINEGLPIDHCSPRLYIIDLVDSHTNMLDSISGLCALLLLPSVRRITCRMCRRCSSSGTEKELREVFLRRGIGAEIIFDAELSYTFSLPSPFN